MKLSQQLLTGLWFLASCPAFSAPAPTPPGQPAVIQAEHISAQTDEPTGRTTITFIGKVRITTSEMHGDCEKVVAITRRAAKPGQKPTLEVLHAFGKIALWQNGRRLFADEMDILPGEADGENRVKVTLRGSAIIQQAQQTLGPSPEMSFWLKGDQLPKMLADPTQPAVPVAAPLESAVPVPAPLETVVPVPAR